MPRKKNLETSNEVFVLTLPLKCEPWQRDRLDRLFLAAEIMDTLPASQFRSLKSLLFCSFS